MKAKSRQRLVDLSQTARKLQQHVEHLEQQQFELSVQEQVLDTLCELLGWLREGIKVHPAWLGCTESWLPPQELSLLQQLAQSSGSEHPAPCTYQQQQHGTLLTPAAYGQPFQATQQQQVGQQQQQQDDLQVLISLLVDHRGDPTGQRQQDELLAQLQAIQAIPCLQHNRTCSDTATAAHLPQQPCNAAQQTAAAGSTPAAGVSRNSSMTAAAAVAAAPCCPAPGAVFITGAGDYLGGVRMSLAQEPDAVAQAMTLESFLDYYKPLIKEMALLLNLAEQQGRGRDLSDGMQHPLLMLQAIERRHMHRINTILLLNPDNLLQRLRVVNVNTLELSDTPEQSWHRMCWMADNLGLSQQQEATLIAGSLLFSRLVDVVRAERQALSAQQGVQAEQRLATGRALDLAGQEMSAQRLAVLIKKEQFLLTCSSLFTAGVLDVVQNAKTGILSWPYIPHVGLLGSVLLARAPQAEPPRPAKGGRQRSSKA